MKILEKIRKINVLCLIVSIIGAIILLVMFEQAIIKLDKQYLRLLKNGTKQYIVF